MAEPRRAAAVPFHRRNPRRSWSFRNASTSLVVGGGGMAPAPVHVRAPTAFARRTMRVGSSASSRLGGVPSRRWASSSTIRQAMNPSPAPSVSATSTTKGSRCPAAAAVAKLAPFSPSLRTTR